MSRAPVRSLIVAALAATLTLAAVPAQAGPAGITAGSGRCGHLASQKCNGEAEGLIFGLGGTVVHIAYACNVTVPADGSNAIVQTGLECWLVGRRDGKVYAHVPPRFTPGAAANAKKVADVPVQGYDLCVAAGYVTATGETAPIQAPRCFVPFV